ncbi:MetQ/NlpA family ABC transporter substrate-binding protein [Rhizobium straminoryzae]|uniref:MetQ/NlpA family ABC transporter substrate-binding protein n=1 Tax=Rhizobium straminoryzae TaxID=1387186 RepID=UPI00319DB5DB
MINANYALEAGLDPSRDPMAREGEKACYIDVIAVRAADKEAPWVTLGQDARGSLSQRVCEGFRCHQVQGRRYRRVVKCVSRL